MARVHVVALRYRVGSVPEYSCTFPFRVPEGTKLKSLQIETAAFDLSALSK